MLRSRPFGVTLGFALFGAVLLALLLAPSHAHAGGGVGSGGTGGSGTQNPAYSMYGYGWYAFTVDSPTHPYDFMGMDTWAASGVNATCKAAGAKSIVAYVVYRHPGDINSSAVFNYTGWPENWAGYLGNNGSPWMTTAQATAAYNSINVNKAGYTWGSNVGWFCYNFANNWNINGQSYIQKGPTANIGAATGGTITAGPGDVLHWFHDLRNTGPNNMDKQVHYQVNKTGFSNGWNGTAGPTGWASGVNGSLFLKLYAPGSAYSTYTVKPTDIGKTLCERVAWSPGSSSSAGTAASGYACADIPYNFSLIPSIGPLAASAGAGASTGPITATVTNIGGTLSYANTSWQISTFTVPPGGTVPPSSANTQLACAYYGNGCTAVATGKNQFGPGPTVVGNPTQTIGNLPPGTQICYALSVTWYDMTHNPTINPTSWRHSTPRCIKIAIKPKMQVWGGDVRTRGNIETSVSTMGTAQYGSWAEFAAFSAGSNASQYNFASGAGFAGGTSTSIAQHNLLTFANQPSGSYGNYPVPPMLTTVIDQFKLATPVVAPASTSAASSLTLTGYATGTYKLTAPNVTINASELKGTSIVLYSSGTVTIAGDILYKSASGSDTFTDTTKLPQLVIIANAINIQGGVKTVNAWLLTTGANSMINTCSDVAVTASLSTTICHNPLVVNGPIMTDRLYLRRTAGSDTPATADSPAEIFNLRADVYLWAKANTMATGRIQTDQLTEAAPRF